MTASETPIHTPSAALPRRRIALLIHSLQGGGAERVMSQLANRWSEQHEIHLITWSKSDTDRYPLHPSIRRCGLDLQIQSRGFIGGVLANIKRVRELKRALRQVNPDIVLSFCDQMNIVALESMRSMPPIPVWIAEHSDPEKQRLSVLWEAWRRRNYHRCTGCVALTDSIAEYMTRWIPLDRLRVIPAVIQSDSIVPAEYRAISDVGFNTILFVGRLSQEKRLELLLAAWQQVEAQLAGWQLKIVGDGPTRSQLEQIAAKLPRVEFVGWQQHPEQFFVSSQMFVLCSRYEGFPVALLEALYHGLPAIATNCSSAIDELNSQSNSGSTADLAVNSKSLEPIRKVSSESVDELAGAILELAHDSQRRQQMSQSAQRVAEHYTWQAIGPKWDRLLNT